MGRHWLAWIGIGLVGCTGADLGGSPFETFGNMSVGGSTGGPGPDDGSSDAGGSTSASATTGMADGSSGGPNTTVADASSGGDSTAAAESTGAAASTTGSEPGSTSAVAGSTDDGGGTAFACVEADLGSAVGLAVASGSTLAAADDYAIGCAGGGGADAIYTWTAPSAATYTFDLGTSTYDTAMALVEPDCFGAELVCNDDGPVGLTSQISFDLAAGEQVLVVIDGYLGATGSYVLDIVEGTPFDTSCADGGDLGSATGAVASGSTAGAFDDWNTSCQSNGADVMLAWTAPAAATYTFSLAGSSYDTILALLSPDCGGSELACNDDSGGLQSQLSVNLGAGETVIIVIDGYLGATGSYTLTIS